MPAELERDLGLYATVTISIGAMVGSGIFVLPGLATKIAGPAVVVAYFLAGVLVLPAALSKAEMATAIPESGGTYLYIDRAMGPLPGTVAGLGAWFSLVFKSAFALVGLGSYLLLFVDVSPGVRTAVALGLAVALLAVNVVGVKQTGRLQAAIVSLVLLVLVGFIADGITFVDSQQYHPFFATGAEGVLAATGFVFVSYAGVTKIASVAEEVEDPDRNIPIGILSSVLVMMLVYTFVVFVVVGVTPRADLIHSLTPMATAATNVAGPLAGTAVAVVAVLALTSMANAGILSSSRFPLAMARDALAPERLDRVSDRFKTPLNAILFTGIVLVVLIAFVPVTELAKLASAFQIVVFAIVNAALVAFRESELEWYDPEFTAPGYPWVQLFGILGGVALVTQMGPLPLAGSAGIVVVGVAWYYLYGRPRTDREGAALDAFRRSSGRSSLDQVRDRLSRGGPDHALVASRPETAAHNERTLVRLAGDVVDPNGGRVSLARFEAVPDQMTLSKATEAVDDSDDPDDAVADAPVPVASERVVAHDIEESVVHHARTDGVALLVGEWEPRRFGGELLGHDIDRYIEDAPCDLLFVRDRGYGDVDDVAVIAERGVYDPLAVAVADAVATSHGAQLRFLYTLSPSASEQQRRVADEYHEELASLCRARSTVTVIETAEPGDDLYAAAADVDLAVVSTSAHSILYDVVFGTVADRLARDLPCTVVLAHSHRARTHTFLRNLVEKVAYR